MVFLKALGKKKLNYKKKLTILYKIHQGYFEKKNNIKINNFILLSKKKMNLILFLKKSNIINFFKNKNKFTILFKNKINKNIISNNYNNIFLKYFENKPLFIF